MSKNAGHAPQISVAPTIEKRKVPLRLANAVYRSREYLTDDEETALMKTAAHVGSNGARDAALILIAYRHGLRVSELVSLRWDQVDLHQGLLHVARREAWHRLGPPLARAGTARLAPTAAGLPGHRLRIRERAQGAALRRCGAQDRRSSRTRGRHRVPGPSAHVAPRHRLQAGQRRAGHAGYPALSGAPQHSAYHPLYLQADLEMKEKALDKVAPPETRTARFKPCDEVL